MHDSPQLPAYGQKGTGVALKEGMILCVEAQILGSRNDQVYVEDNGWAVKTVDGAKAAMFEYGNGWKEAIFLTDTRDWPLF